MTEQEFKKEINKVKDEIRKDEAQKLHAVASAAADREVAMVKELAKYLFENDYVDTEFYDDEDDAGHTRVAVKVGEVFKDEGAQNLLQAEVEFLALEARQDALDWDDAKRSAING